MSTPPHPVAPQRFVLGSSGFEWQNAIKHLICATFHQLKEPLHTGKYPKIDDMPANEKEKYTRLLGGACALVQDSLDKSDLETMRHNKEWTDAYTGNDPIGMMKAAKNTIIQPRMSALHSASYVRLIELTQQRVQDIHKTVALIIDEHNKCVYYNNDKDMDELQHSVVWECLAGSLGPKYQNFVQMEDTRTTTEPKNVVTLIKRAQAFAIRHGLDKKPTETQQPTQTEPPSAFRADTRTPRRDDREQGDQKCGRCGTLGHRPSQCQAKNVWCETCEAEGKVPRQCSTHSTKAHRGPRRQQGKDGKDKRGGNQNRKEGERKTTLKTTEEAPSRQVNFLSINDDSETDDWDDEPVAFASWITEDGPSPEFLYCERVQSTVLVAKDGNCFFSAIGTAAGMGMQEVRNLAASFIEQNAGQASHVPSLTWEQSICLELGKNLDECMRLVRGRAYGGGIEAAALGHALNRSIAVYSKVSNTETGETLGYKLLQAPSQNAREPIWLLWTEGASEAGNHYDLLIAQGATQEQTALNNGPSQPRTYAAVAATPAPARSSVAPAPTRPPASPAIVTPPTRRTTPSKPTTSATVAATPTPTVTPPARKTYASVAATPPLARTCATKPTPMSKTPVNPEYTHREPEPPMMPTNMSITAFNATDEERVGETVSYNEESCAREEIPQQFYLDSGASEHLFDASVATVDNNPRTIAVAGISGNVQARTGSHTTFGRVLINPKAKGRNLVSLSRLRRTHKVTYDDQRDAFIARQRDQQLVFQSNKRLYTLATPVLVLHAGATNIRGIQAAIRLHNTLHHPSDEVLARCLDQGVFDHECSSADLKAAREQFGPCQACIAGKYTTPPAPESKPQDWLPGTCLEIDILFIASGSSTKTPFLLGVDAGSRAATTRELQDRRTSTLLTGLLNIVAAFNLHSGRKVKEVRADSETGFQAIVDSLAREGIRLRIMPPERHARRAERTIRELKNYMRCTISGLPFKLPAMMYRFLLLDAIHTRNVISHQRLSQSPRELLTGRKPNVMEDFRHPFGTVGYTQVSASALISDMFPRSELAVVVGHYISERGAIMVWLPRSNRVVKRHSIEPVVLDSTNKELLESTTSDHLSVEFTMDSSLGPNIELPADPQRAAATCDYDDTSDDDDVASNVHANADEGATVTNSSPTTGHSSPAPSPTLEAPSTPPPMPSTAPPPIPDPVPAATTPTAPPAEPRYPTRERQPPARLRQVNAAITGHPTEAQPLHPDGNLTVRQAMLQDSEATKQALETEIRQMLHLSVIGRRDSIVRDSILPSKMFLKWKSGGILKARLVIGGHMQDRTTMGDTYSPTVNTESVNIILAIASTYKLRPYTIDVSGAFLHVPLQGNPVHMRLNREISQIVVRLAPEFLPDVSEDGKLVVRIQKAIYGLGESSKQWSDHLAQTLTNAGYHRLRYDRSVYIKRTSARRPASILCTHVDDILAIDFEDHHRKTLVTALTSAYGPVKQQEGPSLVYLGVNIEQTDSGFHLHQRSLLEQLDYRPPKRRGQAPVPLDLLDSGLADPAQDPDKFRSVLMRLLYVTSKTRYDLMFAVNVLATRQQRCTVRDEEALAHLVHFAKTTKHWTYNICPQGPLQLEASADASYACHSDGRGHSGIVCSLGQATIFARSGKQKLTAKSSTEAELLALNQATDEVLYLRNLLTELGFPPDGPTTILQDNQSAITMALKGELGTKRTKHFTIRHYFVTEHIQAKTIALLYQPGTQITADGLTKPLPGPQFSRWAQRLLQNGHPISPDHSPDSSELAGACYTIPSGRLPCSHASPTLSRSVTMDKKTRHLNKDTCAIGPRL